MGDLETTIIETIMTTTTTSNSINDFSGIFGEAGERYRVLNEKLIESGKKTGNALLDSYQQALGNYVDFRVQLAEATQLDWVTTVVRAQNDFVTEVNAAYLSAVRDLLG
jgi:hypothetical protein